MTGFSHTLWQTGWIDGGGREKRGRSGKYHFQPRKKNTRDRRTEKWNVTHTRSDVAKKRLLSGARAWTTFAKLKDKSGSSPSFPLNVTRVRTRNKSWRNLVTVLLLLPKRCWITVRRGIPRVIGWVICRKSRGKIYAFEGESLQDASGVRQMVAR